MTDEISTGSSFGTFETQDKILVALSGGVDSSACIRILRDQGFDVQAVVFRFSPAHETAVKAAGAVAQQMNVPLTVEDCTGHFEREVVDPFCARHCSGRTANSCALHGPHAVFAGLVHTADRLGIHFIATGHYARIVEESGIYSVRAALSAECDQSNLLDGLSQEILARLCLPVGEFEKEDIRAIAAEAGLLHAAGNAGPAHSDAIPEA